MAPATAPQPAESEAGLTPAETAETARVAEPAAAPMAAVEPVPTAAQAPAPARAPASPPVEMPARPQPPSARMNGHAHEQETGPEGDRAGCTAPQLRRFIKSRAYVPMHELRRRFAINGEEDDVTPVELDAKARIYVGLPTREGRLLGELLRAGDIGYELSMDPITPIVVGVFPMRPVPRS